MKRSKKCLMGLVMALCFSSPVIRVDAVAVETAEIVHVDEGIVSYADSIITKYRVYRGQLQYRRWNETRGYWVDSSWINI